jgi:hypothetical protein
MLLPRSKGWWDRVHFPSADISNAPLYFASEYWDLNPSKYEGHAGVSARYLQHGRKRTGRDLAMELSQFLLDDVLIAAGGVERAYVVFRTSVDSINDSIAQNGLVYDPNIRHQGVGSEETVSAWYGLTDLIAWCRTFVERLERDPRDRKKYGKQGLLPRLRPKLLSRRARRAQVALLSGVVGEARTLANYSLHNGLVRNPWSGVTLGSNDKAFMPLPDPIQKSAHHWHELTWDQNRDAIQVADELWRSVATCMDELIAAFERSVTKRRKPQPGPA